MGGAFSATAAHSTETDQPALCEYLRYRFETHSFILFVSCSLASCNCSRLASVRFCRADVTIVVSALGTGYSSAVHGVITTVQRAQLPRRQTLQYKALDSGVLCGLVGSSF